MKSDLELSFEADGLEYAKNARGTEIEYSIRECEAALLSDNVFKDVYHINLVKILILKVKELETEVDRLQK